MKISEEAQKSIRTWILLVAGLVWTSYFAFYAPTAMNPYFMTLGAASLFGPSVITIWKGNGNEDNKREGSTKDEGESHADDGK